MKINSIYISAFGGIKNLKLDFNDGFNVVLGNNEQGKTTVMSFIKMMFYGSERASAQISKNIRKKYTPWDGSAMAGSIDFEHSGKRYRLEKEFRSSNSTDKATLCDLDFGTRQAVGSDIGTKFLGLSSAAFERSVFIGQFGYPESDSSSEGEINSKLSNIVSTGEEDVSYEKVAGRLQKAKLTLMSKSGKAGEYDKNIKLCAELKQRIEIATANGLDYRQKKSEISSLEQEISQQLKKAQELKKQIDSQQDIRNAEKLNEFLRLKAELDTVNEGLKLSNGSFVDELYLSKLKFCISKLETAKGKTNAKLAEIETLEKSIEAGLNPPEDANENTAEMLAQDIAKLEEKKQKNSQELLRLKSELADNESGSASKKGSIGIMLIAGIVLLIAALGLFIAKQYTFFGISAMLSAILIAVYNILAINQKNLKSKSAQKLVSLKADIEAIVRLESEISDEFFNKKIKLESITAALNSSAAVIENQQKMLSTAKTELYELKTAEQNEADSLKELFSRYKTPQNEQEIIESIDILSEKTAKQKEIKQQLSFISRDIGSISYEEAREKLIKIGDKATNTEINFEELKAEYEQLLSTAGDKKSRIATLTAEIKALLSNAENPEDLKKQLQSVTQTAISQKEFCDAADIATAVLTESFAQVRRSYGSVLEKTAGEIFKGLTNGKYSDMSISKSFDISVTKSDVFGSKEIDYLSSGTADQAYLALRLALSKLICKDSESLPILLDDALAQYDDTRMTEALRFLKSYSETSQIIMFTCHKAINNSAKELGAECISLN